MPLPRRMFAGERFRFQRPIRVGDQLRRESELTDISLKEGGTGPLVFATVVNRIFGPEGIAIEEERRTVFREEIKPATGTRRRAARRRRPTSPGVAAWSPTPCSSSASLR